MISSTLFGLNGPIGIEDTMTWRWGNRPSQCEDWQFGLREIRLTEDVSCIAVSATRLHRGADLRAKTSQPMMHCTKRRAADIRSRSHMVE
jgi:hypothetical protein